jgi:hypothetical protein
VHLHRRPQRGADGDLHLAAWATPGSASPWAEPLRAGAAQDRGFRGPSPPTRGSWGSRVQPVLGGAARRSRPADRRRGPRSSAART